MKFQKRVPREIRDMLTKQLADYERGMKMTAAERKALHEWVSSGRSPYDNDMQIYGDYGPLDYISAMRLMVDENVVLDTFYDMQTDEVVFRVNMDDETQTDEGIQTDDELPF